jgi:hypothetical protein
MEGGSVNEGRDRPEDAPEVVPEIAPETGPEGPPGWPAASSPRAQQPASAETGPLSGWTVPDDTPVAPRRRFVRLALVGALAVLFVLLATIFVGASQTPFDRAAQRAGQQLLADPVFKSRYGSLSKEEAFQAGVRLGQDGGGRVDDATRLTMGRGVSKLLALADADTCAGIAKGTVQPEKVVPLIKLLDEASLNEYVDAAVKTTLAAVHGDPKRPPPSATALASAYASWRAAVGGDQRFSELVNVLSNTAGHSSAEICTAERQLFDSAVGLPDSDRATVLLVLFLGGTQ